MSLAELVEPGWQPDIPDQRDLTGSSDRVLELLRHLEPLADRPGQVDRREFCREVDLDAGLPSSTRACVDLIEHCERRVSGQTLKLSRHFVYQTAARMARTHGTHALSLRVVWKAVVRFGTPVAQVWPGTAAAKAEPDAFVYSMAHDYSDLVYVRLDSRGQVGDATLEVLRSFLAAGFGFVFGFTQYTSLSQDGEIAFPTRYDVARGGQAVLAVGYDDERRVRSDRGCFLVRGQWGQGWGERGYGWLPYSYVRKQLAQDFWTALHPQWLASGEFHRPWG